MNYAKLVKDLTNEMKKGVQYKRLPSPYHIFAVIGMIPWIVFFVLTKALYMITLFFYEMISAPADYLHTWLKEQKDDVQHATQAVMYFVCLPFIFFLRVLLSFSAMHFFLQWFLLMIEGYVLTLGGIRWQPFITEAKFEEEEGEYELTPGETGACVFVCALFGLFALYVIMFLISLFVDGSAGQTLSFVCLLLWLFYVVASGIVNPCLFKKQPKTDSTTTAA